VRLREATREDLRTLVELAVARCPHFEPWLLSLVFSDGTHRDTSVLAEDADGVVGLGIGWHRDGIPAHQRSALVAVARRAEGQGLGHRLWERVREGVPPVATEVWTRVFDDDQSSLDVARHWGFEVVQRSITSFVDISDAPRPEPREGVTLEPCAELVVPDVEAFDAMLAASQTNPEATNSHVMDRDELLHWVADGEVALVSLARVDGVPAAISFAIVAPDEHEGGVAYTGVDPRFRGRGLARLVKEDVHHQAAELGVRRLATDNEENNNGIRRINRELGYVVEYGVYRMRQYV
jgi:GNAT superfamily N-acetyltransferase